MTRSADVTQLVKSSMLGKGAGAAMDPGLVLLDEKLAKAKGEQRRKEKQWKATTSKIDTDWEQGIFVEEAAGGDASAPSMDTVDGVRVPSNLSGVAAVSFVLTQRKGALKPKDLAAAITKKQLEQTRKELEQAKMREAQGVRVRVRCIVCAGAAIHVLVAYRRFCALVRGHWLDG
jgi:hypothetical protein